MGIASLLNPLPQILSHLKSSTQSTKVGSVNPIDVEQTPRAPVSENNAELCTATTKEEVADCTLTRELSPPISSTNQAVALEAAHINKVSEVNFIWWRMILLGGEFWFLFCNCSNCNGSRKTQQREKVIHCQKNPDKLQWCHTEFWIQWSWMIIGKFLHPQGLKSIFTFLKRQNTGLVSRRFHYWFESGFFVQCMAYLHSPYIVHVRLVFKFPCICLLGCKHFFYNRGWLNFYVHHYIVAQFPVNVFHPYSLSRFIHLFRCVVMFLLHTWLWYIGILVHVRHICKCIYAQQQSNQRLHLVLISSLILPQGLWIRRYLKSRHVTSMPFKQRIHKEQLSADLHAVQILSWCNVERLGLFIKSVDVKWFFITVRPSPNIITAVGHNLVLRQFTKLVAG